MRFLLLIVLATAACTTPGSTPAPDPDGPPAGPLGPATLELGSTRAIVGHVYAGWIQQVTADNCEDCDDPSQAPPFAVTGVTCTGCKLVEDPTSKTSLDEIPFTWTPIAGDSATLTATLSWPDGEVQTLPATAPLDREVSVTAACWYSPAGSVSLSEPCGTTRRATDTLEVATSIVTAAGYTLRPGCVESDSCEQGDEPSEDVFTVTGVSSYWERSTLYLVPSADDTTATISVTLAGGGVATTTLTIPALAPS